MAPTPRGSASPLSAGRRQHRGRLGGHGGRGQQQHRGRRERYDPRRDGQRGRRDYSLAAGRRAKVAAHDGAVLFADSTDADFPSAAVNELAARANGGVRFVVGNQTCSLNSATGAWACTSDRVAKQGFAPVDGREVLERLQALPISSWSFRGTDPAVRHLGPTAQDFRAAFGLGADDATIGSLDAQGVALAAIQGLHQVVRDKDAELASLRARLAAIEARLGTGNGSGS